jgi:hypothetical protein
MKKNKILLKINKYLLTNEFCRDMIENRKKRKRCKRYDFYNSGTASDSGPIVYHFEYRESAS